MQCGSCDRENRPDSRFCVSCGEALAQACAHCEAEVEAGDRFCARCGAALESTPDAPTPADYTPRHLTDRILTTRSALEGERKQVTIVFVDVENSTELSGRAGAETWHGILDRFFQILSTGIHRFEGSVNQYTGDGIMALFGAPIAHEDHGRRAGYAALHLRDALHEFSREIRREHGLAFTTRMGLHSGEVIVGRIGDDLRMDYTAQGQTVAIAARLQELAEPGTPYLSGDTARLLEGYFDLEDLGGFKLRGLDEPVSTFGLLGTGRAVSRLDVSRSRGLSAFVGRGREMEALEAALSRSGAGDAAVVGIVADAGVGKSRLCFEFVERCRLANIMVSEATCLAHGRMIPYAPILQLMRAYLGINEHDDDRAARDKIAGRLLLFGEEFREMLPIVFDFLGVAAPDMKVPELDPEVRRRQLYALFQRVYQVEAADAPTVTLIEDLHWLDGSSEDTLEFIVGAVRGTKALVVLNFRPEYSAPWMRTSHYEQLAIRPLGRDAIREMLETLLGADPSLAGLAGLIDDRTGGNPFFIEEAIHDLAETGALEGEKGAYRLMSPIASLRVPESVQTLLAARIDRLPDVEKRLLQTASVIGKTFPESLLRSVCEVSGDEVAAALAHLIRTEFLFEAAVYPEAEFEFKHPLTQQVAYESQLAERRRSVHAALADALIKELGDQADEKAALIGGHLEGAGDLAAAAKWHNRAADWIGIADPNQAARQWRHVIEVLEGVDETPQSLRAGIEARRRLLSYGWRIGFSDEELSELYLQAKRRCAEAGDHESSAIVTWGYGIGRAVAGHPNEMLTLAGEAIELALASRDEELAGSLHYPFGFAHARVGLLERAVELADVVLRSSAGDPSYGRRFLEFDVPIFAKNLVIESLCALGRLEQADRALVELQSMIDPDEEDHRIHLLLGSASCNELRGTPERSYDDLVRQIEQLERRGDTGLLFNILSQLAPCLVARAEFQPAIDACERSISIVRDRNVGGFDLPGLQRQLAKCLIAAGQDAREVCREAISLCEVGGQAHYEGMNRVLLACALLHAEGAKAADEADTELTRAEELLLRCGANGFMPEVLEARAALAGARGDSAESDALRAQAIEAWRAMGSVGHVARLEGSS